VSEPVGVIEEPPPAPPPTRRAAVVADAALRVAGGLLSLVGGLLTGLLTVLLVPLRVAHLPWLAEPLADVRAVRLPGSLIVAIGGALFLVWFARQTVGVRWGPLLPVLGWFTMVVLALRTSDAGDRLLMPDDWVGALALFGGTLVLVLGAVIGFTAGGRRRG
jgi:hypothetical protein